MSAWKAKRFWKTVAVEQEAGGYGIRLDTRALRTPAKRPLIVPRRALAEAIAREWEAQEDEIRPLTMPFTRSANAAIDKVGPQRAEVVALIAAYADSDLLCYRADSPAELVARQAAGWDPLLDWAAQALDAPLEPRTGVMHAPQDETATRNLAAAVEGFDDFALTAVHDLVSLSGSLVLGLAVAHGELDAERAWALSRIDEDWQIEQWGEDEEAAALTEARKRDFMHAAALLHMLKVGQDPQFAQKASDSA